MRPRRRKERLLASRSFRATLVVQAASRDAEQNEQEQSAA